MSSIIRFVNQNSSSPTTLLDLNASPLMVKVDGIDLSPPPLRRVEIQTFLGVDGDIITDTASQRRTIKLPIQIVRTASAEAAATAIRSLHVQLSASTNVLMVQLDGMTNPVFFHTFAAPDYTFKMLRLLLTPDTSMELEIPALAHGYGPKVTLSQRTIYNAFSSGAPATLNGDFETDATGWSVETGGSTFVRSTSQFHAGAASGLVTPDGTTATVRVRKTSAVTAAPGEEWLVQGWLRCGVSRTINLDLGFFTGADALIGSWTQRGLSVSANTWQFFAISAVAPANTAGVRIAFSESSTPAASNTIFADELRLRKIHTEGSQYTDISGVLGDADTPLFLRMPNNFGTGNAGRKQSLLAMRKGGNPANVPFLMESEDFSFGTDISFLIDANDADVTKGTYVAVTYATVTTMTRRLYVDAWPIVTTSDLRGKYDVYARVRLGSATAVHQVQLGYGFNSSVQFKGDVITIPNTADRSWFYVYLGTLAFPSGFDPVTEGYSNAAIEAASQYIEVSSARISGSSGLDFDTISFVPADDESCLIQWPATTIAPDYVLDGRRTAVYAIDSNGRAAPTGSIAIAGAVPMLRPGVTNRLFWFRDVSSDPQSPAILGTGDHPDDSTVMTPFYYPRYWMIRTATT